MQATYAFPKDLPPGPAQVGLHCGCGRLCGPDWPTLDWSGRPTCRRCEEAWRWGAMLIVARKRDLCPTCHRPGFGDIMRKSKENA